MRWIASFGIALLTSMAAMFGAGTVAGLAVDWYNVSSFEGGAGFFVVGMALVGLIAGFLIGLVVSRIEARQAQPRFIERSVCRPAQRPSSWPSSLVERGCSPISLLPQIDGEELFLLAEIR